MNASPKVSILVSCYNHAPFIEACLRSVLEQSYPNIELIVIDDGSSDSSFDIIKRLADENGFHAEKQANTGLSRSLNKMLGMATGQYICQFGSDDIMLADKTARQVAFMEANPEVAVCGGNAIIIDRSGNPVQKRQRLLPDRNITFDDLFTRKKNTNIVASTGMIRREVLDVVGGWNPDIPLEDIYMWLKITSRGYRMHGMPDVLMYYRKHGNNSYKNLRYMYTCLNKTIDQYSHHPAYADVQKSLRASYFLAASKHDRHLAREILLTMPASELCPKIIHGMLRLATKEPLLFMRYFFVLVQGSLKRPFRVVIKGGLGNQMFQYAYGKALSDQYGRSLILDLSFFERATADRQYVLGGLIGNEACSRVKPVKLKISLWKRLSRINLFLVKRGLPPLCTIYLDGYWQSEKYFLGKNGLVRSLFHLPAPPASLKEAVTNSLSVAVHVRRGDYVNNVRRHICHLDYFYAAMRQAKQELGAVTFFIFSDDIEWCQEIQHEFPDAVLIKGCTSDAQELNLMSLCKHIIISNSSFSWWAAWLREYPGKKVYAPSRWIDDERMNQQFMVVDQIVPERWIKIDI